MRSNYLYLWAGDNEGDNTTIQQLRQQIDALTNDLKTVKADSEAKQTRLTELEREKMNEIERLNSILSEKDTQLSELVKTTKSYEAVKEQNERINKHLLDQYEAKIGELPENQRETVKKLTFNEKDPLDSFSRLDAAIALMGKPVEKQGEITNPSSKVPAVNTTEEKKFTPGTTSWKDALKPIELPGKMK